MSGWQRARTTVQRVHRVLDQTCCVRVEDSVGCSSAGPVGYGPSGSSAPGRPRMGLASGHAAARRRDERRVLLFRKGEPATIIRVNSSSTEDLRLRGALPKGDVTLPTR
jgi:hypothetical protein